METGEADLSRWSRVEATRSSTGTSVRVWFPMCPGDRLVWERFMPPGTGKATAHVHLDGSERFEVVSGTVSVSIYGVERTLSPGDVVDLRASTPHRDPWNDGDQPAIIRRELAHASTYAIAHASTYLAALAAGGVDPQDELPSIQLALLRWRTSGRTFQAAWPPRLQRLADPILAALARVRGHGITDPPAPASGRAAPPDTDAPVGGP